MNYIKGLQVKVFSVCQDSSEAFGPSILDPSSSGRSSYNFPVLTPVMCSLKCEPRVAWAPLGFPVALGRVEEGPFQGQPCLATESPMSPPPSAATLWDFLLPGGGAWCSKPFWPSHWGEVNRTFVLLLNHNGFRLCLKLQLSIDQLSATSSFICLDWEPTRGKYHHLVVFPGFSPGTGSLNCRNTQSGSFSCSTCHSSSQPTSWSGCNLPYG